MAFGLFSLMALRVSLNLEIVVDQIILFLGPVQVVFNSFTVFLKH